MREGRGQAVVIGAGLGGLACALRLSVSGWRVSVLERHDRPGGKLGLWEAAGARVDTGPTLVTMPWAFNELFQAAGVDMEAAGIELMRVQPFCRCHFADGSTVTFEDSLPGLLSAVRDLDGDDAGGFLRVLRVGAALYDLSAATFFVRSPREGFGPDAIRHLRRVPVEAFARTYGGLIRRHVRDPRLRCVLERYATYVGSHPACAPALLSVIPAAELLFGGWHIRGGLYRLVEVLTELLSARGVEVRLGCEVTAIRRRNGRVAGVETRGGAPYPCDVVVLNADVDRLPGLLGGRAGRAPAARSRSLSGLVLLYVIRGGLEGWPHHQVAFSGDYEGEFRQLFAERRFPEDPTVYVCAATHTDPSLAPDGLQTLFLMANAPASDDAWDEGQVALARGRMVARLARAGLSGWQDRVVASTVRTPRYLADALDMPGGAIYGRASHGWRSAAARAPNRVPGLRGLYAVGGSTHPGGGTPTVLMSARIVSEMVDRDARR